MDTEVTLKTDVVRRGTQLDWELNRRRIELSRLERELAERELELATFKAELAAFQQRCAAALAPHYAEIDELEALVAEKASQLRPDDATKRRKAEKMRARADESAGHRRPAPAAPVPPKLRASDELKKLYRDLTKLAHPDLATEPEERQRREAVMIQANAAYADGDAATLAYLLGSCEQNAAPPAVQDAEAALDRIMRQIAQATARLEVPAKELEAASATELAKLFRRSQLAGRQGRDLLVRLVEDVEEEKRQVRKRLKQLERRLAKASGVERSGDG
jgi:hypothetical protein